MFDLKKNAKDVTDLAENWLTNLHCQRAYVCKNWRFQVQPFVPGPGNTSCHTYMARGSYSVGRVHK